MRLMKQLVQYLILTLMLQILTDLTLTLLRYFAHPIDSLSIGFSGLLHKKQA